MYFRGPKGEDVEYCEIPERMKPVVEERRQQLLETLGSMDETIMDQLLEGQEPSVEDIHKCIREAVHANKFAPVLMGSAFKNKGVQPLIDAICEYLPAPHQRKRVCFDKQTGEEIQLSASDANSKFVGLAFKLEETKNGQLTWLRVYQGELKKGGLIYNCNTDTKVKVPKLLRMHAGELEEIPSIKGGDICAMFGVDCASGETFTEGHKLQVTALHVPDPVISLSVAVKNVQSSGNFMKALKRFAREDPTFHVLKDPETQETLIAGMGELHLDIYMERMRREYEISVILGKPRVNFRETIMDVSHFNFTLKKQTGGAGQYAKIIGRLEPIDESEGKKSEFVNDVIGNNIPPQFIPAIEKGYNDMLVKGPLIGNAVDRVRMVITDGGYHVVDSSEYAFRNATHLAFKEAFMKGDAGLLEPIMILEAVVPIEFQSSVITTINKRRGTITNATIDGQMVTLEADVPLALMFGYSTELRSCTEGKGEFTMEYKHHKLVSADRLQAIIEEYKKKAEAEEKRSK
eukprot:TRINITY_DN25_c0_g1_i4.p1 TRINITY_DN25_c0_g1~~TRINITY_DN25_c0_g1_i4.p1  ORF type:complete len:518 (-),score=121.17 TRINITY_DN25_c0_g1_i4:120-1673(-)